MKNRILLLNKIACTLGIVLLMAGTAKADLVLNFTGANAHEVVTLNVGTLAPITEPATDSTITSLTYTVSGLTIDADGVGNDTATFTIGLTATDGGSITWDQNGDGIREFDHDTGTFSDGEGISFGAITVSGTGSGGQGYQLDSALYNEFTVRRFGAAESYSLAGDVTTATVTGDNSVVLNDNFFTATSTGDTWNATDVDFTVEVSSVAIPEPTSLSMFGLGIVGLIARRRRA